MPWPTHGDLVTRLLTSFRQHPRCFILSFYLVFQPRLSILPRKGQTATHRCPTSQGRRGEARGLTIALKSSRCPYIQDLCHLVLTASPGEGDGREAQSLSTGFVKSTWTNHLSIHFPSVSPEAIVLVGSDGPREVRVFLSWEVAGQVSLSHLV